MLDVHSDPEHHRSVLTLGGTPGRGRGGGPRGGRRRPWPRIDLRAHVGVHPRFGAADVVPFVPSGAAAGSAAGVAAGRRRRRDRFAAWAGPSSALPCFLYGPERSLPDVRRSAFVSLDARHRPATPHPTAGATRRRGPAGAGRLQRVDRRTATEEATPTPTALSVARALAAELRGPTVRSLGPARRRRGPGQLST